MRPIYHIAHDWAVRCFGERHVNNPTIRAMRLVEEAIEYAQASGVTFSDIATITNKVYEGKPGEDYQEMGGIFMTAIVACVARGWDPDRMFTMELRRVLEKPPEHFAARNRVKLGGSE